MDYKKIYSESRFKHLFEVTKYFDINKEINTSEEATQALIYVAQILQNISYYISSESLQDSLDQYLPDTRLNESNEYDIDQHSKNLTLINKRLNLFLTKNPNSFIEGTDQIVGFAINYTDDVRTVKPISENVKRAISVYKTVLNTFNNLIEIVDDRNKKINESYQCHKRIIL